MVRTVNVHEAKTHLSRLIAGVEAGEDVVIARAGKPVARLTSVRPAQREIGFAKDEIWIAPDFDAPLEDEDLWYEGEIEP